MRNTLAGIVAGAIVGGTALGAGCPAAASAAQAVPPPRAEGPRLGAADPAPPATGNAAARRPFTDAGSDAPDCAVDYTLTAGWPGGFLAEIRLRNVGTQVVSGWSVSFTMPDGQAVEAVRGALHSHDDAWVTLSNAAFNGTLPAGAAVTVGFQVSSTGTSFARPTGFLLNGRPCGLG